MLEGERQVELDKEKVTDSIAKQRLMVRANMKG
jgi:hypothetical protein